MKSCYVYLRVATEKLANASGSIESQKFACFTHAKVMRYRVVGVFTDVRVSGSTKNRPGLSQLIKHCKTSPVDAVIVYRLDRIARDFKVFNFISGLLNSLKVKIISLENPNAEPAISHPFLAQQYLYQLSEKRRNHI